MGVMSAARRVVVAGVVFVCSLAGSVLLSAPAALAVAPPVVEEAFVSNVASSSATLHAKIDPEGSETTYRFEYGTSTAYGSSVPVPDGIVGSGIVGVAVSAHPQDLSPSTTYHYRVVALVASRSETVPGSDGTFMTQPAGGELALPDGRQWELVSPPNKRGALIFGLATPGIEIQAAADGGGITYLTNVATEPEPAGYQIFSQILSTRGDGGWSSRDISAASDVATGLPNRPEYQLFSPDLSAGLADPEGYRATSLLSEHASEPTPYIRNEDLCEAVPSECFLPLLTGKEGYADVPPGTQFGGGGEVLFQGASPDLKHVLLVSRPALTSQPTSQDQLYEWSAGAPRGEALQLISLLPANEGGGPTTGNTVVGVGLDVGSEWSGSRHSVSDDGTRVFWEAGGNFNPHLYMRDTVKGETIRLDTQQPGAPSGEEHTARFEIASSDGSRVFFTDGQRLTATSGSESVEGAGTGDLYECEIVEEAGRLKCRLADLTPERGGESAEVQKMVLGASEDGSYIYFVANGVLAQGATPGACRTAGAVSATCNLYVYHEGVTTFIATLSMEDETAWGRAEFLQSLGELTARASSDGRYLTFNSNRPLTGYDTRDAISGKPDQEVYLYDAQTKRLACVSCDPTGSRPVGVEVANFGSSGKEPRQDIVGVREGGFSGAWGPESWTAANIPPTDILTVHNAGLYQPRVLSNDGRLFFNSNDALVPQDVNAQEDVYEFEPDGTGNCSSSSATFDRRTSGCVNLVSSGASPEESGFLDASESGGDAFFLTTSRLTSQDVDTSYDIYDAHECSVSVPCTAAAVSSPPCESGDSCKSAPSPQPAAFGAPASATFTGAGNVVPVPASGVKVRSLTRAQKLARALRACRERPKRKRGVCKRRARARYGTAVGARKASGRARG
jgi:WD40-like Beta Propeller Repeat